MIDHLDIPSTTVHKDSAEGQAQDPTSVSSGPVRLTKMDGDVPQGAKRAEEAVEEEEEDEEDLERRRSARRDSAGSEESETADQRRKNQFSFVERATQTRIRPVKVNNPSLLSSFLLNTKSSPQESRPRRRRGWSSLRPSTRGGFTTPTRATT